MQPPRPPVLLLYLCLLLLVGGSYLPSLRDEFCNYDDPDYVTMNKHVQKGLTWPGVQWAFSHSEAANWHPMTWLSHMVDCQVFDLKPWGHHLTNLLLHCANTLVLFFLLSRMTGSLWRSFFVAGLFGLHPLHVESVAWVAERKDVLSTLFFLLTIVAYVGYAEREKGEGRREKEDQHSSLQRSTLYALALLFFALGLLSKPMLVTLPFVLLLLDYWPLERLKLTDQNPPLPPPHPPRSLTGEAATEFKVQSSKFKVQSSRLLLEKLPFFALSIASCVVTFIVQRPAMERLGGLPLSDRVGNALVSYGRYLGKLFWPSRLAIFYPHPGHWPWTAIVGAVLLLAGITVLVTKFCRPYPFLMAGWLWFLGTLVPVIGVVQVGLQSMADRYAYIPSMGFFVMLVWGICELSGASRTGQEAGAGSLAAIGVVALLVCAGLTIHQLGYWKDSETLFRHDLAVAPGNEVGLGDLGNALNLKGRYVEGAESYQQALRQRPQDAELHFGLAYSFLKQGRIDDALKEYQEVLRAQPRNVKKRREIAKALLTCGRLDDAVTQFREALQLHPEDAESLEGLGDALLRQGRIEAAIAVLELALKFDPDSAAAHDIMGIALTRKDRVFEAIGQFQQAIRLKPNDAKPHNNLGMALQSQGRLDEAIGQLQQATKLRPDDPEMHNNLGAALGRNGRLDEATRELKEALRLKPDYAQAHNNLALGFSKQGRFEEAIAEFEAALKLNETAETHASLGMVLAKLGRKEEAIVHFKAALKLRPNFPEAELELRALQNSLGQ